MNKISEFYTLSFRWDIQRNQKINLFENYSTAKKKEEAIVGHANLCRKKEKYNNSRHLQRNKKNTVVFVSMWITTQENS